MSEANKTLTARLLDSHLIASDVREFRFEAVGIASLPFTPGQFVSLTAPITANGETKAITRAYSLAAAPDGTNQFSLCLNLVKDGLMSPHLFAMQPGDTIEMLPPLGSFVLRDPEADAVMIATGTGVAPFRAMLQQALEVEGNSRAFTLLLGARYESHILYRNEFEQMQRSYPQFQFIPTLTRPSAEWTGKTGRVQAHLREMIAGRQPETAPPVNFYLCGMKQMVDEVRSILKEIGFDRRQIRAEKYD